MTASCKTWTTVSSMSMTSRPSLRIIKGSHHIHRTTACYMLLCHVIKIFSNMFTKISAASCLSWMRSGTGWNGTENFPTYSFIVTYEQNISADNDLDFSASNIVLALDTLVCYEKASVKCDIDLHASIIVPASNTLFF